MQDVHNIAVLEHVNINVPSRELATEFFLRALFMTQDPYENTGRPVMWINIGGQQIHLVVSHEEHSHVDTLLLSFSLTCTLRFPS